MTSHFLIFIARVPLAEHLAFSNHAFPYGWAYHPQAWVGAEDDLRINFEGRFLRVTPEWSKRETTSQLRWL